MPSRGQLSDLRDLKRRPMGQWESEKQYFWFFFFFPLMTVRLPFLHNTVPTDCCDGKLEKRNVRLLYVNNTVSVPTQDYYYLPVQHLPKVMFRLGRCRNPHIKVESQYNILATSPFVWFYYEQNNRHLFFSHGEQL